MPNHFQRYFKVDTNNQIWQALSKEHIRPEWSDEKWDHFISEYQGAFCAQASQMVKMWACDYEIENNNDEEA